MDGGIGGDGRPGTYRRRLIAVALAAIGVALASPASAVAALEKGLFFEQSDALTIAWDDLAKKDVKVGLCNAGRRPVTGLRARLVGLAFEVDKKSPTADVLAVTMPERLASGQCEDMTIAAGQKPDSAAYAGSLLVTSAGAGAVRRGLTVSGAGYLAPGTLKATRETTPFTAAHKPFPFKRSKLKGDKLALREADAKTAPVKLLEESKFVGRIYKDGFSADVKIAGKASPVKNGQFFVPIKIEGATHVGTYSGSLDLTGGTKEADRIAITVVAKDGWMWAVGAIVVGVFVGLVPVLVRRRTIRSDLCADLAKVEAAYKEAADELKKSDVPEGFAFPDVTAALTKFRTTFEGALAVYRDGAVALDRKDKGYLRLTKMLAGAKKDAAVMGDRKSGLGPALAGLNAKLDDLDSFLRGSGWSAYPPSFRKHAWPLLAGGDLAVGGSIALKEKAVAYTTLVTRWVDQAKQVWEIEEWSGELMAGIEKMDPADRERLADAQAAEGEARTSLRHVTKLADIDPATAAATFRAHGALTYLAQRYPELTKAVKFDDLTESQRDVRALASEEADGDKASEGQTPEQLKAQGLPALDTPAAAVIEKGWRLVLDWGVIALAVTVALVTSLSTFYFGKPWGTTADYVAVILVGTGSQVVLKALTDSLTNLRESRTDPEGYDAEPVKATAA